jgi:hypothetical protein
MNSILRRSDGTVVRVARAVDDDPLVAVLWLQDQRRSEQRMATLRAFESQSSGVAIVTSLVAVPLLAVWVVLRIGADLPNMATSPLLLAGLILPIAGLTLSAATRMSCRLMIRWLQRHHRFQPVEGDTYAPPACPTRLWCGRYAELDGKVALHLELWTHEVSWQAQSVGPPQLADPDDAVAIGEARARIEVRAGVAAGRLRSVRLESEFEDDRRRRALAMARTLAED